MECPNLLSMECRIGIILALITALCSPSLLYSQQAYAVFNDKGKEVSVEKMLKETRDADVIIFGELHNNPICHWMELEILNYLSDQDRPVIMGMEMFERDQQKVLDELMAGVFELKKLDQYTRSWPNYGTDYKPLVAMALERNVPIIATNVPRRYASLVFKQGMDSLSKLDISQEILPDLDFSVDTTLATYAEVLAMGKNMPGHGSENFLNAQALKDVAMAEALFRERTDNEVLYHINGGFHSKNKEGICHYLMEMDPELRIITIQSQEVENPTTFQQQKDNLASFHLQINTLVTKSYE